jgi:hypothetical protein
MRGVKPDYIVAEQHYDTHATMLLTVAFKQESEANEARNEAEEQLLKRKGDLERKGLGQEFDTSISANGPLLTLSYRESSRIRIEEKKEQDKPK